MYESPTMKTKEEILAMVEQFDRAEERDDLDDEQANARMALNWVLGHHEDSALTDLVQE